MTKGQKKLHDNESKNMLKDAKKLINRPLPKKEKKEKRISTSCECPLGHSLNKSNFSITRGSYYCPECCEDYLINK